MKYIKFFSVVITLTCTTWAGALSAHASITEMPPPDFKAVLQELAKAFGFGVDTDGNDGEEHDENAGKKRE